MIDPITLEVMREALRVDRARDARHARAHRLLVHPLRGRGLLLRAHGRRRPDRGHVQGPGPSAAHRAHRLVDAARCSRSSATTSIPGDVFLHNDPYTGGTHLNDVAMIYPLFAPGAAARSTLRLPGRARALGRRRRHEPGQPLRRRDRDLPGGRAHSADPHRRSRAAQRRRAGPDLRQHARPARAPGRLPGDGRHVPEGGGAHRGGGRALWRRHRARGRGRADGPRGGAHAPRDRRAARRQVSSTRRISRAGASGSSRSPCAPG